LNLSPTFMYGLHVLVDHASIGHFMNSDNQKKIVKSAHKPPFEVSHSILSESFSMELTPLKLIKKLRLSEDLKKCSTL